MSNTIPNDIESICYKPDEVKKKASAIYHNMLEKAPHIDEGNFRTIGAADLKVLFELYDDIFFSGLIRKKLEESGERLTFRLAPRLTSAGANVRRIAVRYKKKGPAKDIRYEIAVSTHLLFNNFQGKGRAVEVNGCPCKDRLEALQRLFEHELVHVLEFLFTGSSGCKDEYFKEIAWRVFRHSDVSHRLVTTRERALTEYGIRMGDLVNFSFQGVRCVGRVNAITKRATVLVESKNGRRYSDGKRYSKYYVPLDSLRRESRG
jgi:hypothetical protein